MPIWTGNNSGGYGYNQNNNYNSGYGRQNNASDNQSGYGFGFGNRRGNQRNTPQSNQAAAGNRQQNMNQRDSNYNSRGMNGGNRQQTQNAGRSFGFGNQQQFQQQYQQPTQGMPPNMPGGFNNQQQPHPSSQGMNIPPNMPSNYGNPQQQQNPQSAGLPPFPGMPSGFGEQQQFSPNTAQSDPFEEINRGLPDGVKYYPIDKNNFPMPGIGATLPSTIPPPASAPPLLPQIAPVVPPVIPEHGRENNPYYFMEKFIQNEQNGAVYYKHLATLSPTSEMRGIISDIGNDCTKRRETFTNFYAGIAQNSFSPANVEINNLTTFHDGILFAIKEESKTLRELSEAYENSHDEKIKNLLNSRMYRKVSDISYLHYLNYKI